MLVNLPCLFEISPEMIYGSGLRGPLSIDSFLVGGASLCSDLQGARRATGTPKDGQIPVPVIPGAITGYSDFL